MGVTLDGAEITATPVSMTNANLVQLVFPFDHRCTSYPENATIYLNPYNIYLKLCQYVVLIKRPAISEKACLHLNH